MHHCKYCTNDFEEAEMATKFQCRGCLRRRDTEHHRVWRGKPGSKEKRKHWAKRFFESCAPATKAVWAHNCRARKYGLDPAKLEEMIAKASGKCQCCFREAKKLMVDHDHITGRVRGLICGKCNTGLGLLDADRGGLSAAQEYLKKGLDG